MSKANMRSPESTLRETINNEVRKYVMEQGRHVGRKTEAPDPGNQGTNPFRKNSCPFDLLLEIDARLLMLEIKIQIGTREFQHMDDPDQLKNLQRLWKENVKIHYAFNMDVPCPDFAEDEQHYPSAESILTAIAAVNPEWMGGFSNSTETLDRESHLKRLIDDSEVRLPDVLNRWPMRQSGFHTTAFLLIAYNLEKGNAEEIPFEQFKQLVSLFQTGEVPHNAAFSPQIIDQVTSLRTAWEQEIAKNNALNLGGATATTPKGP